jgi:hypothetical protein
MVGVLLVGCGESKVAQCNKLIAVANKAATESKQMSQSSNPDKIGQLSQMADKLDQYAKEIQAVEIKDDQLKGFQGRFAKMYQETGAASRALIAAVNKKDPKGIGTSSKALQTASGQEGPLVSEVNSYCSGK